MDIDSVGELRTLLKSCRLTVSSVAELEGLLARINAGYDPDAARVRAARRVATVVPVVGAVMAFLTSFYLLPVSLAGPSDAAAGPWPRVAMCLGGLGITWGLWAAVSLVAILRSFRLLRERSPAALNGQAPLHGGSTSTGITRRPQEITRPGPF